MLPKSLAINESGFLFNPQTGDSFKVNATGQFIIELLQKETPIPETVHKISETFMVSAENAERDVADFLQLLRYHQLFT